MKHLDAFMHQVGSIHYLMMRNKNTAYAMGEYLPQQLPHAERLVQQYKGYSDAQLLNLYITGKHKNLYCVRYDYSFADVRRVYVRALTDSERDRLNQKLKDKGEKTCKKGYAICARLPGMKGEVIVDKSPLRKDCESILRSWRAEYTGEELLQKIQGRLEVKRQEWKDSQRKTRTHNIL